MIITHCKKLKYKRKIVLITNGRGRMNSENLEDITKKIKEDNIELVILYVVLVLLLLLRTYALQRNRFRRLGIWSQGRRQGPKKGITFSLCNRLFPLTAVGRK